MENNKKVNLGMITFIAYAMAFGLTVQNTSSIVYANILAAYPNVSELIVEQVVTVSSLVSTFFVLGTGVISAIIPKKTLAVIGLSCELVWGGIFFFLAGKAPIGVLIAATALLGIGHGIIQTTYISIIPQFFDGDERAKKLGQQLTCSTVGGIVIAFVIGQLSKISWNSAYLIVILQLIMLILVIKFMPALPAEGKEYKDDPNVAKWYQLPGKVWLTVLGVFIFFCGYLGFRTKVAVFVTSLGLGDSSLVGTLNSVMSIAGCLTGLIFGKIFKKIKGYTFVLAFIVSGIGIAVFTMGQSVVASYIGMFIVGLGLVFVNPSANTILTSVVSPSQKTLIVSIVLCAITAAGYLQTFISAGLANLFGDGGIVAKFWVSVGLLVVGAVFGLFTTAIPFNKSLKEKKEE